MRKHLFEISKFVIIGFLNTFIDFAIYNALMWFFEITEGFWILPIVTTSFIIVNILSYFLNKNWTFNTNNTNSNNSKTATKFMNFVLISIGGLIINNTVIFLVTTYTSPFFDINFFLNIINDHSLAKDVLWANVAKIFATAFSMTWNFLGYKFIIFKK